ncbi:FAD-binding oxidoreductase [Kitasatospora sp. NPDC048298]|uniref:FAD-binding oxidoreductase n=1 Tax=Kitasatospora sp. NPDC048298 TaxID=3364049 RepID=UPI00371DC678
MRMPDGKLQPRQYSLTRADDGEHRQFSVKRVRGEGADPDGEMSTLLHDSVKVGDTLTLSPPYGDVVLDDAGRPVVFASAGIGIAPMAEPRILPGRPGGQASRVSGASRHLGSHANL